MPLAFLKNHFHGTECQKRMTKSNRKTRWQIKYSTWNMWITWESQVENFKHPVEIVTEQVDSRKRNYTDRRLVLLQLISNHQRNRFRSRTLREIWPSSYGHILRVRLHRHRWTISELSEFAEEIQSESENLPKMRAYEVARVWWWRAAFRGLVFWLRWSPGTGWCGRQSV